MNIERAHSRLEELYRIGQHDDAGAQRLAFSQEDRQGRALVAEWLREAGLAVEIDGFGNVFGSCGSAPYVLLSSHTDSVPNGGRYDGALGVVAAVELAAGWPKTGRGLMVADWSCEESSRFRKSSLGVRQAFGDDVLAGDELRDRNGLALREAAREAYGTGPIRRVRAEEIAFAFELHVDQGTELLRAQVPLAVVRAIAAAERYELKVVGQAAHTGGSAYADRHDALVAASELILRIRSLGEQLEAEGLRATATDVGVSPGASNVVPAEARVVIDVRIASAAAHETFWRGLRQEINRLEHDHGVEVHPLRISGERPVTVSSRVAEIAQKVLQQTGHSPHSVISWPSHDSLIMAQHVPVGMLLVRNPNGISHHPDEQIEAEDFAVALEAYRLIAEELGRC